MKYTTTFKCGHTATIELFGSRAEKQEKLKVLEVDVCPKCNIDANWIDAGENAFLGIRFAERVKDDKVTSYVPAFEFSIPTGNITGNKQFETIDQLKQRLRYFQGSFSTVHNFVMRGLDTAVYMIKRLKEEGYDLYNLSADGHVYCLAVIGEDSERYEGGTWKYEDEMSPDMIDEFPCELRKRKE